MKNATPEVTIDARDLRELELFKARMTWLHTGGGKDPDGYEWGVFRVKWDERGQPASVLHTFSDLSDLDAEMKREQDAANLANYVPMSKHGGVELIDKPGN